MFPTIQIGSFSIPTYTFLLVLGVSILIFGFFLFIYFKKKIPFDESGLVTLFLGISLLLGYLGGYVFDGLLKIGERGGFYFVSTAFYGGFLFASISFIILMSVLKKAHKRLDTLSYLNILTPFVIFAHTLGRLGCFAAGCCYGAPTDSWAGVVFPNDAPSSLEYGPGTKVYATQIYEMSALIAILIMTLSIKFFRKNAFIFYLLSYALARFIIEFYRGDDRGQSILLSPSQWVAIVIFILTLGYIIFIYIKTKRQKI